MNKIPEGLVKCGVCGQYKGRGMERDLNWEGRSNKKERGKCKEYFDASCLCDGILCRSCSKNKINRPISNSYDAETNTVWHWPYFSGMNGCKECREKKNKPIIWQPSGKWGQVPFNLCCVGSSSFYVFAL